MDRKRFRIDSFVNSNPTKWVRVTDTITGLSVEGKTGRSEMKLRNQLIEELEEKIKEQEDANPK